MPLFEYHCRDCDREYELLVRNGEPVVCPECGSADCEKLLSVPAARVSRGSLPVTSSSCPPPDAPPCGPGCCRLM
ncbi:MAG: zinc ribbon domain-containing protein [Planctomycetes bacterium]|nr:zinc ribbon domain-containing protein [Planctomycetota bacterium]